MTEILINVIVYFMLPLKYMTMRSDLTKRLDKFVTHKYLRPSFVYMIRLLFNCWLTTEFYHSDLLKKKKQLIVKKNNPLILWTINISVKELNNYVIFTVVVIIISSHILCKNKSGDINNGRVEQCYDHK